MTECVSDPVTHLEPCCCLGDIVRGSGAEYISTVCSRPSAEKGCCVPFRGGEPDFRGIGFGIWKICHDV
jgi:hypothetical protein